MWCSILTDTASNCPSRLDTFFGARNAIAGSALRGEAEAIDRKPDIGARISALTNAPAPETLLFKIGSPESEILDASND